MKYQPTKHRRGVVDWYQQVYANDDRLSQKTVAGIHFVSSLQHAPI